MTWLLVLLIGSAVTFYSHTEAQGEWQGMDALLWIPFHLLVLAGAWGTLYHGAGLMSPRVDLLVNPADPRLGDLLTLAWEIPRGAGRVTSLEIVLKATRQLRQRSDDWVETALGRYRVTRVHGAETVEGTAELQLPTRARSSVETPNEIVRWELEVRGKVSGRVDIRDLHRITIAAPRGPRSSTGA